jgi:hypothetical protein
MFFPTLNFLQVVQDKPSTCLVVLLLSFCGFFCFCGSSFWTLVFMLLSQGAYCLSHASSLGDDLVFSFCFCSAILDWPQNWDSPASVSWALGLQVCTTTPGLNLPSHSRGLKYIYLCKKNEATWLLPTYFTGPGVLSKLRALWCAIVRFEMTFSMECGKSFKNQESALLRPLVSEDQGWELLKGRLGKHRRAKP